MGYNVVDKRNYENHLAVIIGMKLPFCLASVVDIFSKLSKLNSVSELFALVDDMQKLIDIQYNIDSKKSALYHILHYYAKFPFGITCLSDNNVNNFAKMGYVEKTLVELLIKYTEGSKSTKQIALSDISGLIRSDGLHKIHEQVKKNHINNVRNSQRDVIVIGVCEFIGIFENLSSKTTVTQLQQLFDTNFCRLFATQYDDLLKIIPLYKFRSIKVADWLSKQVNAKVIEDRSKEFHEDPILYAIFDLNQQKGTLKGNHDTNH